MHNSTQMQQRELGKLLATINKSIGAYFEIRYENNKLALYRVIKTKILDADGNPVIKKERADFIHEGSLKSCIYYVRGMIGMNAIGRQCSILYQQEQMENAR